MPFAEECVYCNKMFPSKFMQWSIQLDGPVCTECFDENTNRWKDKDNGGKTKKEEEELDFMC